MEDNLANLTNKNVFAYALHMYNNPSCTGIDEFNEDLVKIKYTKRLLHRYVRTGDIPIRLLLNHVIGLYNVFQAPALSRMLFLRVHPSAWSALKTVLEFLSLMPAEILPINGAMVINTSISRDDKLWGLLHEAVDVHTKGR